MTIAIDTNIIAALWSSDHRFNAVAFKMLERLHPHNDLVVSGPVYAELMAGQLRTEQLLDRFLNDTGILVDWALDEGIWREAGRAYRAYAHRRHSSDKSSPRRILADFLIGAHAFTRGYSLLTLDERLYSASFPRLKIISN
jgi:predicted nucleic acid-binding protein